MSTSYIKHRTKKYQRGLSSVEMCLIAPVILVMMHITVSSAKMLAVYQQRVIESRNAAYITELYMNGETDRIDRTVEKLDVANQKIEEAAREVWNFGGTFGNFRGIDVSGITGRLVDRYPTIPEDSSSFFESMLVTSRDNMNSYHVEKGDPGLMTPKIKKLYSNLDDHPSGMTTGVSYSQHFSAAGIFHVGFQPYFQRTYHHADFSNTLDLATPANSKLKPGYDKEMRDTLRPEKLFTSVFPDSKPQTQPNPGWSSPLPTNTHSGFVEGGQLSAEEVNKCLASMGYADPPPFKPRTTVTQFQATGKDEFVRVIRGGKNRKEGMWIMKKSAIAGLTPEQIADKFALPNVPTHVVAFTPPIGTVIYNGTTNSDKKRNLKGGGQQYLIAPKKIGRSCTPNFVTKGWGNVRPL